MTASLIRDLGPKPVGMSSQPLADAVDLLFHHVGRLVEVFVTDEKALPHRDVGARLADYLGKHGLQTTVADVATGERPIAETLQTHALGIGAGVLVMGGFGHSRVRDFVLGGATSGILRDLKLPALISH